jgi:hypothetical protein
MKRQSISSLLIVSMAAFLITAECLFAQWSTVNFVNLEIPTIHLQNGSLLMPVFKQHLATVFYRSDDNGANWDSIGALGSYIYEMQNIGDTLFASSIWACTEICPPKPSVFRSFAHGSASWDTIYTNVGGVYNLVAHNSILFISEGDGYKKSDDYGTTWARVEFEPSDQGRLFSIDGILYSSQLYKSLDNGNTWTSIRGDLPTASVIGIQANASFLFAFTDDDVFRSSDDGRTWKSISAGLPSNLRIWNLGASDNYLAAAGPLNVYFSKNNGDNWVDISDGLSLNGFGSIFRILFVDNYLFAATDEGIWRYDLSTLVSIEDKNAKSMPDVFKLEQNYPNPFNPNTVISYGTSASAFVTLKVYDILGRELQVIVSEFQAANYYSVTVNATNLPSGIYFYQLRVGNHFIETKKMILAK